MSAVITNAIADAIGHRDDRLARRAHEVAEDDEGDVGEVVAADDVVGLNRFHLSGRVGGRALAPGSYLLELTSRAEASHFWFRGFRKFDPDSDSGGPRSIPASAVRLADPRPFREGTRSSASGLDLGGASRRTSLRA